MSRDTNQFTSVSVAMPPKGALIEWITPSGQIERGRWEGGAVWFPEGSDMYVYYKPLSWRLAQSLTPQENPNV